ncbi:MAG: septum formation family protein [Micropruina sp.]
MNHPAKASVRRVALPLALLFAAASLVSCSSEAPRNSAGEVTASAVAAAASIKVGDCTGELKEGSLSTADLVPCAQAHYFEAYASKILTDGDFPGEESLRKSADTYCNDQFETFVGVGSNDSTYVVFHLTPVAETWATGDRQILCLAGSEKGGLTGSLKGTEK